MYIRIPQHKDLNMYSNCIQWDLVYPDPKDLECSVNQKALVSTRDYKISHLTDWDFGIDIIAYTTS